MSSSWEATLAAGDQRNIDELLEFLRIPSVSTLPDHRDDMVRAAEWVAKRMRRAGVPDVSLYADDCHPIVLGRWQVADSKPTVLIYGHYDVQPVDPVDLWETPPFEPTIRDGRIYARGASDMKGNLLASILAVEALVADHGAPPVNLIFLYEGEEEVGSSGLQRFVAEQREQLSCDVAISADGVMYGVDAPSLLVGLKGITGGQINLRTAIGDLHSGMHGGTVRNAAREIAHLVASLHDADGRVAVAGFYDRVRPLTDDDRTEIAAVPFDEDEYFEQTGVSATAGEAHYTPLERLWARPTLDINGIWGGFQGEGGKTVTPSEAHAKFTCRLVPNQDPAEIFSLIEQHVARNLPPGVTAEVQGRSNSGSFAYEISRDNEALRAAGQVLRGLYDKEPLITRVGGSIPIVEVFKRHLAIETVVLGWSMPDSQIHAPNEWFRIDDYRIAQRAYASLLEALA